MLQRRYTKVVYFARPVKTVDDYGDVRLSYNGEKRSALARIAYKKVRTFPKSAHHQKERYGTFEWRVVTLYLPKNTQVFLEDGVFFHPFSTAPEGKVKSVFFRNKFLLAEVEVMP